MDIGQSALGSAVGIPSAAAHRLNFTTRHVNKYKYQRYRTTEIVGGGEDEDEDEEVITSNGNKLHIWWTIESQSQLVHCYSQQILLVYLPTALSPINSPILLLLLLMLSWPSITVPFHPPH